jgi:hypothetical protein
MNTIIKKIKNNLNKFVHNSSKSIKIKKDK